MKRRSFLQAGGGLALSAMLPAVRAKIEPTKTIDITAAVSSANIVGPNYPATDVWAFNGEVPGTTIRLRHGQTLKANVLNQLKVPTAVHWHGIRLPNAMDGVAGLTQEPIAPGESFLYEFTPPDAGTYWYHSHVNAFEQVGRGLYGPLIIEEVDPPFVDQDLVWMIDDWRLDNDAAIVDDFNAGHDRSHAGRIGNVPTVNGKFNSSIKVATNQRIRLRLINASNARNFSLSFGSLTPSVIAIDGQSVTPYSTDEPIVVGAAGRVDLIIDMTGDPKSNQPVVDSFYRKSFELVSFDYEEIPARPSILETPIALKPANLPEPDMANTISQEVVIAGGAMGGLRRAKLDGEWMSLSEIAQQGYVWALNDVVGNKLNMPPLIDTKIGQSIKLTLINNTAFPHPMHLHGHHMKLLSIDGQPLAHPRWVDSPLLLPNQTMVLAFVADNPGDWLFHCHALEHHAAGLGALVTIS